MDTSPLLVVAWPLLFVTLLLIWWRFASGPTDVVAIFVLVFGLFYGFRPLLMMLGLDVPYPAEFFDLTDASALAATTLLWLIPYLALFALGVWIMSERIRPQGHLWFAPREPSLPRMLLLTFLITGVAAAISLVMIILYGGLGSFQNAVKVDKALAGLYFLKVPASVGAIISVATFIQVRSHRDRVPRSLQAAVLACAVVDAFSVFVWAQRSLLVILGVLLLLGLRGRSSGAPKGLQIGIRLTLAVVIVLGVSLGLRYARDTLISGEVGDVVDEASAVRQLSLGSNSIYFDSSMLAFRDWPRERDYRMGEDFVNGASGAVPRLVWEGKPETTKIGRTFRNFYQPDPVNGWPVGTPTTWYINFGPLGLGFGGLLSGFAYGWIRRAQANSPPSGLNSGLAVITGVFIFQLGVGTGWPADVIIWLAPLWPMVWFVSRAGRLPGLGPPAAGIGSERPSAAVT